MSAATSTELATREDHYEGLTMVMAPAEAQRRLQQLQAFVQSVMVKDVDYGVIPGTEKPTLYQAGAQKLAEVYGFAHHFEPIEAVKEWDRGFFYFEYRCVLTSRRDGCVLGEGIGSCNSQETKYAGRWVPEADVPPGLDRSKLRQKTEAAWLFDNKLPAGTDKRKLPKEVRKSKRTGGEYAVYQLVVTQYQVPNLEIASIVNTLQKMACKRAYVHAVIAATRSSAILTQDMEDLPPEAFGRASPPEEHDQETGELPHHPPTTPAPPPVFENIQRPPSVTLTKEQTEQLLAASSPPYEATGQRATITYEPAWYFDKHRSAYNDAATQEQYNEAGRQANFDAKAGHLDPAHVALLKTIAARRKAAIAEAAAPRDEEPWDAQEPPL